MLNIQQSLENWDNKSASDIESIYQCNCEDEAFCNSVIALMQKKHLHTGLTWLLKHHLKKGHRLSNVQTGALCNYLPHLEQWQAKLHLLQSLAFLTIAPSDALHVERFLRFCLSHANKFVRAWAYSGFYALAQQHTQYQEEAESLLRMAARDEAPSVQARIRQLQKAKAHN